MNRGQGTGGVWGGRTPPRIRDLCSKNFENSQIQLFFQYRTPMAKNVPSPLLMSYKNSTQVSRYITLLYKMDLLFRFEPIQCSNNIDYQILGKCISIFVVMFGSIFSYFKNTNFLSQVSIYFAISIFFLMNHEVI